MENNRGKSSGLGLGIAGMVLGIMGLILAIIPCIGIIGVVFGIIAVVFGSISLSNAARANTSRSMGLSGLLLGLGAILVFSFWMLFFAGAKDAIEDKFDMFNSWNQHDVNINIDEEFEDVKSLDELEATLDELESQLTDSLSNKEINVNVKVDVVNSEDSE